MSFTYTGNSRDFLDNYYILNSDNSFCLAEELSKQAGCHNVDLAVYGEGISVIVPRTIKLDDLERMLVYITLKTSITFKMVDKYI